MKYNILIMLLFVLCLFGCSSSESEPQSVAFEFNEYSIDEDGGEISVNVTANCNWSISIESKRISIPVSSGEGNVRIFINISPNKDFRSYTFPITLTSEDKSSTSTLIINQDPSPCLQAGIINTIPAEGGNFSVPVKTNDEIISIETPDWITHTPSKGLTDYVYSFTAAQNQTKTERKGTISLKGKKLTETIEVTQEPYVLESVVFMQDYIWTTSRNIRVPISFKPEYADLSKLYIKSSTNVKSASIEEDYLTASLYDYGILDLYFYNGDKQIGRISGEYIPSSPFQMPEEKELYVGQKYYIDYWYYASKYILTSSNTDVVEVLDNKSVLAKTVGKSRLTVTHPYTESKSEITVKTKPFLIEARIGTVSQQWDGTFNVAFAARIEGPKGMTCSGFLVTDKNGYIKIQNKGSVKDIDSFAKKIHTPTINVSFAGFNNINEALRGYHFLVEVIIDGKVYQRTVAIDTFTVEPY